MGLSPVGNKPSTLFESKRLECKLGFWDLRVKQDCGFGIRTRISKHFYNFLLEMRRRMYLMLRTIKIIEQI